MFCVKQEELVRLQQRTLSADSLNDETTDANKIDPLIVKRMAELHQKLDELRSSRDANNGVLDDIHLIPYVVLQNSVFIYFLC